jgi:hypothetical protein
MTVLWIDTCHVRLLDAVAVPTGQAEVVALIASTECLRNDVIERKQSADDILLALAVATSITGA